jgi:hypothetical protein
MMVGESCGFYVIESEMKWFQGGVRSEIDNIALNGMLANYHSGQIGLE